MKILQLLLVCPMLAEAGSLPAASGFNPGASREYELAFPKRQFIGAPSAPRGAPPVLRPRGEQDYERRFIRVTFVEQREVDDVHRMVLRIDEIDKYHRVVVNGLYYAYVDISAEGTRSLCKIKDDNWGGVGDDNMVRHGLPIPFDCTVPPLLAFTRKSARNGYLTATGFGVDSLLAGTNASGTEVQVEAIRFQKLGAPSDNLPSMVRWHGAEVVDVSKTNRTTQILFREKQEWAKMDDWLWTKMERFDNDGHLLLRCVQWTNSPAPATRPDDVK